MASDKKDKIIAALFAWFTGALGGHHFYLGNSGKGLLYLFFCWVPITWLAAFIDAISLLTMSQDTFDKKYNAHLYSSTSSYNQLGLGSQATNVNVADEIHKLDMLFKRGVLTFEEFERRKAKLLNMD
jgi:TM2 domain-containing membrane protein YozV